MQNSTPAPPTNSTSGKAMERGPTVRSIFDGLSAEDFQRAIDLIQVIADGRPHPEYGAPSPSLPAVEEERDA